MLLGSLSPGLRALQEFSADSPGHCQQGLQLIPALRPLPCRAPCAHALGLIITGNTLKESDCSRFFAGVLPIRLEMIAFKLQTDAFVLVCAPRCGPGASAAAGGGRARTSQLAEREGGGDGCNCI